MALNDGKQLLNGSVAGGKLADATIATAKLIDLAVARAKIADSAINAGKLADEAVTSAKILDLNVTTGKLAANAVTPGKADLSVTWNFSAAQISGQAIATQAYADSKLQGLDAKDSVRAATRPADGTIDLVTGGPLTIDAVALVEGDRVLVKDQPDATQNGIYVVAAAAWQRASDANTDAKVTARMYVYVEEGSQAGAGYTLSNRNLETVPGQQTIGGITFRNSRLGAGVSITLADDTAAAALVGGGGGAATTQVTIFAVPGATPSSAADIQAALTAAGVTNLTAVSGDYSGAASGSVPAATLEPIELGTTELTFTQFNGAGQIIDGDALLKTGNRIDVRVDASTIEVNGSDELGIVAGGIDTAQLADGAVEADKLGALAVTTAKIADVAVTTGKIADVAVTTGKIADVAVATGKLADVAVTTAKLANEAVTAGKLASDAVTTVKVADLAVTTGKIADEAVTEAKLADGAVTEDRIADGAVTAAKLADGVLPHYNTGNLDMTPASATTADGEDADVTSMAADNALGGAVRLFVNGKRESVANGDGERTAKAGYFSGNGGGTARAFAAIVAGDCLYWNGSVAGYELATTDRIDFDYLAY